MSVGDLKLACCSAFRNAKNTAMRGIPQCPRTAPDHGRTMGSFSDNLISVAKDYNGWTMLKGTIAMSDGLYDGSAEFQATRTSTIWELQGLHHRLETLRTAMEDFLLHCPGPEADNSEALDAFTPGWEESRAAIIATVKNLRSISITAKAQSKGYRKSAGTPPAPHQQAPPQPAPHQQAPLQPAPLQLAPVQPAFQQPAFHQQAPLQQAPVQPAFQQPAFYQQAPVQQAPVQPAPNDLAGMEWTFPDLLSQEFNLALANLAYQGVGHIDMAQAGPQFMPAPANNAFQQGNQGYPPANINGAVQPGYQQFAPAYNNIGAVQQDWQGFAPAEPNGAFQPAGQGFGALVEPNGAFQPGWEQFVNWGG